VAHRRLKLTYLLLTVGLFLSLHEICLAVFRSNPTPIATYPFLVLAPSFALTACLWRTRMSAPHVRMFWILFSLGLMLWTSGMLLSTWEDLFERTPFSVTFLRLCLLSLRCSGSSCDLVFYRKRAVATLRLA
jgi:hypothetical protein